jgi:acetyl esterase
LGDLEGYDSLCRKLCHDAMVNVLSIDYRLAPEHKAPAAVEDAYAAFRWATRHAIELGVDQDRIAVGGDSAGGTVATVVSMCARDDGAPMPCLQVLIYPATDMAANTRSRTLFGDRVLITQRDIAQFREWSMAGSDIAVTDWRISPALAADKSGLPPALVITAGFDPLRDEGNDYAQALREACVAVDLREMRTLTHGFMNFGALGGSCGEAIETVIDAVKMQLHGA